MIVHVGYVLLIICAFVECDYDETSKTHVGELNEMINKE
jgi:hypothetical protein